METNHVPFEQLSGLLDGELEPNEQVEVERHLVMCDVCRLELESLRSTVMRLSALPSVAPPRSFALPGAAPVAVAARPQPWLRPELLRAFAGLAAVLMLMVVSADFLRPTTTSFSTGQGVSAPAAAPAAIPPPAPADAASQRARESAPAGGNAGVTTAQQRAAAPPAAAPAPQLAAPATESVAENAPVAGESGAVPAAPASGSVASAPTRPSADQPADLLVVAPSEVRAFRVDEPARGPGGAQVAAVVLGALAVALFLASFAVRRSA